MQTLDIDSQQVTVGECCGRKGDGSAHVVDCSPKLSHMNRLDQSADQRRVRESDRRRRVDLAEDRGPAAANRTDLVKISRVCRSTAVNGGGSGCTRYKGERAVHRDTIDLIAR